jgi:plastocyanin
MSKRIAALSLAAVAAALAACAGRDASQTGGNSFALPSYSKSIAIIATLPEDTIGEELPNEGLGTVYDAYWKEKLGTAKTALGGFTQTSYSQALGFPPGTKITLTNLSQSIDHTLDVVKKIKGPPAKFPASPTLSMMAHGNGVLGKGYASGVIDWGQSVTVTLSKAGTYLIGCYFHYKEGMHTVLVVEKNATPGPEGTPPAQ